jgi:hypothetical protein
VVQVNHAFVDKTTTEAPFILVLGEPAFDEFQEVLQSRGWTLKHMELKLNVYMFRNLPRIYLASDSDKIVRQVILRCYHGEYSFHHVDIQRGALTDFMWNLTCELADVEVQKPLYFMYKASTQPAKSGSRLCAAMEAKERSTRKAITVDETCEAFPILAAQLPDFKAHAEAAVAKGHSALSPVQDYYRCLERGAKMAAGRKRKIAAPIEPPRPKALKNANNDGGQATKSSAAWQASAEGHAATAGQQRGQATAAQKLDNKYQAFLQCYQVRQLEAQRGQDISLHEPLRRLDRIKEWYNSGTTEDRRRASNGLCNHVVFYSKKHPRGLRYQGDGGPPQSSDPYAHQPHPAVHIMRAQPLSAAEKNQMAGPVNS